MLIHRNYGHWNNHSHCIVIFDQQRKVNWNRMLIKMFESFEVWRKELRRHTIKQLLYSWLKEKLGAMFQPNGKIVFLKLFGSIFVTLELHREAVTYVRVISEIRRPIANSKYFLHYYYKILFIMKYSTIFKKHTIYETFL